MDANRHMDANNMEPSIFGDVRVEDDDGEHMLYWNNLDVAGFLDGGSACYWYDDDLPGGPEDSLAWGEFADFLDAGQTYE
jgi:hypothetical protein